MFVCSMPLPMSLPWIDTRTKFLLFFLFPTDIGLKYDVLSHRFLQISIPFTGYECPYSRAWSILQLIAEEGGIEHG